MKKTHGKLKDEHGHHIKHGINSGAGKCWTYRCFTSTFGDNICLIFVFIHSIKYEINKNKTARILYV
jgi:hypothetical protein